MSRGAPVCRLLLLSLALCPIACDQTSLITGGTSAGDASTDPPAGTETIVGTVEVRILDHAAGSLTQYLLDDGQGRRFVLDFETDPLLKRGDTVELHGFKTSDGIFQVSSVGAQSPGLRRLSGAVLRRPANHLVAILSLRDATVSEEEALDAMNASVDSVQNFYAESTLGVDTFVGEVFRKYEVDYTEGDCQYNHTDNIANAVIQAFADDGFDPSSYDHIAVIVPQSCGSNWSGAWAYLGGLGGDGKLDFARISMYKDDAFAPWLLAHGLGHNLGLNHARSMNCGSAHYEPAGDDCSFEELGNLNEVMGSGTGVHFGAPYQRHMGWIGAANVATVGKSGTFNLQPADGPMCGVRALRIPIPGENGSYFYVEYRKARDDSRYAGTGDFGSSRNDAVLVTRSNDSGSSSDSSHTDRVELGTSAYVGASTGQRYDLGRGVTVEVLSMADGLAQVFVETPGSEAHRDDTGAAVPMVDDGTIGKRACGDEEDLCPADPNKTEPGICGCGVPDTDSDGDDTADCRDNCPDDPDKIELGICGCGVPDTDSDGDDTADCRDNCPDDPDKIEPGECGCGVPDTDSDGDDTADCRDNCPDNPDKIEPGECGCGVPEGSCGAEPYIEMSKATYDVSEPIVVRYYNLPGNATDWVGIFNAGAADTESIEFVYSRGAADGTMDSPGQRAGRYDARLFFNDSYVLEHEVSFTVAGDEPPPDGTVTCTVNPYAGVNWSTYGQHKANYHTHTTRSDGDHSPATVIDQYHRKGYTVLAITDHNTITWPWTDYGRDPDDLGMVAVRGDEYSSSHHMNAFYNFSTSRSDLESGIPHVQASGGMCQINHPGRYSSPSDWNWYVSWYRDYPACFGLEVINRDDAYPNDRKLWDNINERLFEVEGRFVWGLANDDKHDTGNLYRGFQFMLLPNLSEEALRTSQRNGAFYFCSEPDGSGDARVPRITRIALNDSTKEISIQATGYNRINWIGPGTTTVNNGATFSYATYADPFIRAVLKGDDGDCYTQPFGFATVRD